MVRREPRDYALNLGSRRSDKNDEATKETKVRSRTMVDSDFSVVSVVPVVPLVPKKINDPRDPRDPRDDSEVSDHG